MKASNLARCSVVVSLGMADLPYTPNAPRGEIALPIWWHIPTITGVPRLQTQDMFRCVILEEIV